MTEKFIANLPIAGSDWTWSTNGIGLISHNTEEKVQIWNGQTGELIKTLPGRNSVKDWNWSPDGSLFISQTEDQTVRIWNGTTGDLVGVLPLFIDDDRDAVFVTWALSGERLVTRTKDGTMQIWDLPRVSPDKTMTYPIKLQSPAWSPDGRKLTAVTETGKALVWDIETESIVPLTNINETDTIDWSFDSKSIITSKYSGTAHLWNVQTGTELPLPFYGKFEYFSWSPDGLHFIVRTMDGIVQLWGNPNDQNGTLIPIAYDSPCSFSWSPNGMQLVTTCEGVKLWDVATGKFIKTFEVESKTMPRVYWSPEGNQLVSTSEGKVQLRNGITGQLICNLPLDGKMVSSVKWSSNGTNLVTITRKDAATLEGIVQLWDARTGKMINTLPLKIDVTPGAYDVLNASRLVLQDTSGSVEIWDGLNNKIVKKLVMEKGKFLLSSDGTRLVTRQANGEILLWNSVTGDEIARMPDGFFPRWASNSRNLILASTDGTVQVWDGQAGIPITTLSQKVTPFSVLWSPNNKLILTVSKNGLLQLWDISKYTTKNPKDLVEKVNLLSPWKLDNGRLVPKIVKQN